MYRKYYRSDPSKAEQTLLHIIDIIREGVWDWDALSGNVERSPGWYRMLGYDVDSLEQNVLTWENVIHPDDYERVMKHFEAYINGDSDEYRIEYRCRRADGSYLWIEDIGKIVERTREGKVARMIGAHLDIHTAKSAQDELNRQNELLRSDNITLEKIVHERTLELQRLNAFLRKDLEQTTKIANYDTLTSLYNRHMFEEMLHKEMSRAKRYSRPMSLIMLDIDHFKEINDRYGHQVGDSVLRSLASILAYNVRESDIVSRWGGEEFIIILPDTDRKEAVNIAQDLRLCIDEAVFEEVSHVTCSFGVTEYGEEDTVDSIFSRIDQALYHAKELGRNNVQYE